MIFQVTPYIIHLLLSGGLLDHASLDRSRDLYKSLRTEYLSDTVGSLKDLNTILEVELIHILKLLNKGE